MIYFKRISDQILIYRINQTLESIIHSYYVQFFIRILRDKKFIFCVIMYGMNDFYFLVYRIKLIYTGFNRHPIWLTLKYKLNGRE